MNISIDTELKDVEVLQKEIQACIDGLQTVIRDTQPYLLQAVLKEQDNLAVQLIKARVNLNNFINSSVAVVSEVLVLASEVRKLTGVTNAETGGTIIK